ncbi:hypothetical protein JTB14_034271 [Gonioctena quinquepunctata]|nr:hypothetical protein JTB14_034271 [Gonioctena quinquepunctata]
MIINGDMPMMYPRLKRPPATTQVGHFSNVPKKNQPLKMPEKINMDGLIHLQDLAEKTQLHELKNNLHIYKQLRSHKAKVINFFKWKPSSMRMEPFSSLENNTDLYFSHKDEGVTYAYLELFSHQARIDNQLTSHYFPI